LENVNGWNIKYSTGKTKLNPRAFLRWMLAEHQKLRQFHYHPEENRVTSWVNNFAYHEMPEIKMKFQEVTGMQLDLKGQVALFA